MEGGRRLLKTSLPILLTAAAIASARADPPPDIPAAIHQDPPVDTAHPASGNGVQFLSHGATVNAHIYRPAGAGVHPAVILFHGLPGNEQNLDLARAMQRAGWTVLTFHYRGSWGSGGTFALGNGCEDAEALLERLKAPGQAENWGIDSQRIVLMGHSYGGYAAACAAAKQPDRLGVALIAPWDISYDNMAWGKLGPDKGLAVGLANFDDVDGRLTGADAKSLTRDILRDGKQFDLSAYAPALTAKPLLLLTVTRDDPDDQAIGLLAALKDHPTTAMTTAIIDTDHGFNDRRIALEIAVLNWLATLPGAPAP
jgi:pimeloyl-ACP methyl ester carboxylesterase